MSAWPTVVAGLGGTALGGTIGAVSGWWLENIRWMRGEQTRWLDERRELYTRFLAAATEIVAASTLLDIPIVIEPTPEESIEQLLRADAVVRSAYAELELFGDADVIAAAKRLRKAAWELVAANGLDPTSEAAARERERRLDAALKEWDQAQHTFKESARQGILPIGS